MDPIVLEGVTLPQFVEHLIESHLPPSTLIVCSSRDAFIQRLLHALNDPNESHRDDPHVDRSEEHTAPELGIQTHSPDHILSPILRLLAKTRTLKVAFCASLPALRAYLSVYGLGQSTTSPNQPRGLNTDNTCLLAILNPLSIHHDTSSWSAQGLGRTLAAAIAAASRAGQRLILLEDASSEAEPGTVEVQDSSTPPGGQGMATQGDGHVSISVGLENSGGSDLNAKSPWMQQVAILNVTTRSFGVGDRGWVGRTVRVRKVAERWCRFVEYRRR